MERYDSKVWHRPGDPTALCIFSGRGRAGVAHTPLIGVAVVKDDDAPRLVIWLPGPRTRRRSPSIARMAVFDRSREVLQSGNEGSLSIFVDPNAEASL